MVKSIGPGAMPSLAMQPLRPDPYATAGVSIDRGDALVRAIAPLARATARPGALPALGGFGAFFDPKAAGYTDPLLVAATDGVGTKLKIAIETGLHDGVGQDLVAMCVNDLIVQGAEPLFFLDYFACGRLDVGVAERVVAGIARGCAEAGAALVGGETAEMPGMYAAGDYDLAGFAVGAVERGQQLTGDRVIPGDVILGLASSGAHSNGFSLLRKLVAGSGLGWSDPAPWSPGETVGAALMTPTRIYVRATLPLARSGKLKALAHITGGGLIENPPRILPDGCSARFDAACWPLPPVFEWAVAAGALDVHALARTFNCGLGMIAVVAPDDADAAVASLRAAGETVEVAGRIVSGQPASIVEGPAGAWGQPAAWSTA